jgi:flagellar motor protein MotB
MAEEVRAEIRDRLREPLRGKVRESGDDVLIDVYLNFERDSDEIREEDRERLQEACLALRELLRDRPQWKSYAEIWIEGHTDGTPPKQAATPRDAVLYNWRLSSQRATSVLYEFSLCGVAAGAYRIRAIGYADTVPLAACGARKDCPANRRTTFRIRPDKAAIEQRENFGGRQDCQPPAKPTRSGARRPIAGAVGF